MAAKKNSDGEWQSIGVPNIDAKKDLQILGDIAKVENEIIQVDRANKTTKHQSRKIKPQGRSNELG